MLTTVRLTLGFSRTLAVLLSVIHIVAVVSAASLSISLAARCALALLIIVSLVLTIRQHCFRTSTRSIVGLTLKSQKSDTKKLQIGLAEAATESWWLELASDSSLSTSVSLPQDVRPTQHTAKLVGSYLVTPRLVLLNFKIAGRWGHFPAVIFADATDAQQLRRLRVLLLH